MVSSIGGSSNLIQVITANYFQTNDVTQRAAQESFVPPAPPSQGPPPPPQGREAVQDPLGMFDAVDSDGDGTISESEYAILTEGILEVTGSTYARNFLELDTDGDGLITGTELKSVLDEAGFAPPPPPHKVIEAYETQQTGDNSYQTEDATLLEQLLAYLENRDTDVNLIV